MDRKEDWLCPATIKGKSNEMERKVDCVGPETI
jgi:hypothetical protein